MALNASGVRPRYFRSADPAQLMQWAAQSLALLGIDRIRYYAQRTRHLNRLCTDHGLSPEDHAEYARIWPCSPSAVQSCHDAAWRLAFGHRARLSAPLPRSGL